MSEKSAEAIPEAVRNLRLVRAFRGNYTPVMDCIESTTDKTIFVVDDEETKISRFATAEEAATAGFRADNEKEDTIHLLAIDNRLIRNLPGGIADCALFNKSDFQIIEFKLNAEGNTPHSIDETYRKAISQIEHTLEIFSERISAVHINFVSATQVRGIVVVSPMFPRARAVEQNYIVDFTLRTGLELSFEPYFAFN